MPAILLFVFIYRLWLIPVFRVWLWERGFVVTPLTDWLLSSPFFLFEEIPHPHVYSRQRKRWFCPENTPPATLTPRGHGNIHTGEHYWLRVPLLCSLTQLLAARGVSPNLHAKDQTSPSQLNSNGKFRVIQTVSSEATGLLRPLTKAKHKKYTCALIPPRYD